MDSIKLILTGGFLKGTVWLAGELVIIGRS